MELSFWYYALVAFVTVAILFGIDWYQNKDTATYGIVKSGILYGLTLGVVLLAVYFIRNQYVLGLLVVGLTYWAVQLAKKLK